MKSFDPQIRFSLLVTGHAFAPFPLPVRPADREDRFPCGALR
jgi:hypothetical protein